MNKPGSRNYRSTYEDDSVAADLSSLDTKKGGHPALNNNLFYYNNNTNATSITTIANTNNAPQQALYNNNNTLTSPGASEEYLTSESLTHYMNLPIEADLAALSFARALAYPPSSNQAMDSITIQATLGPSSFETPMYTTATTTTSIAALPTPPAATMVDTQTAYYGTFETPYPATMQSFQDPRFFAPDQQQPPPYPGLGSPPPPIWAPQSNEAAVGALYNNSLDTTATLQRPLQPQPQLQQQHYYPHTLHYTHQNHLHLHQPQEGMSPHFLSDLALSPPPPLHLITPFTEVDDSFSSQGTSSSSSFSSDEDEDETIEEKADGGPSTPSSFSTKAMTYREKAKANKRRAPPATASPKSGSVPTHPKHPKLVKTSKVKPNTNANAPAKPPSKLHPCKECGRLFTRACNLQSHQTTHLRQKPYPCPDCCLAFARVYDMKRHHRIHTNVRPYQCAACPEAFKRIEARERHFLAHHGYPTQGV